MSSRSLFEYLTGYEEAAASSGSPPILSGDAVPHRSARGEEHFHEILAALAKRAEEDPQFAQKMADAFGVPPDPAHLRAQIAAAREIVARSGDSGLLGPGGGGWSQQEEALEGPELLGIPKDFSDGYVQEFVVARYRDGFPAIDLEPKLRRFEDRHPLGVLGWLIFNGPEALSVPRGGPPRFKEQFGRINGAEEFRRHGPADSFVYRLEPRVAGKIRVALLADFGTGLAPSRFIARQIAVDRFDAAVHLGDVYYTGEIHEYERYFETPLEPALRNGTKLFVIPDNHDAYSGFHAYADFLKRRLTQKGSYFAIETKFVQFIGVDTIWHSDRGRIEDAHLREWLAERFAAGRAADRANVLLTGHQPYSYKKTTLEPLNGDVLSLAQGALDLWFWGNTHYCALFDRSSATPYYGSCVGHAGYPYERQPRKEDAPPSAAPVLFVEAGSRYEGSDVRPDRGMNGFCSFEIDTTGAVDLHYRDWRGHERCVAQFARQPDGTLMLAGSVVDHTHG